jgi:hypothetical protein
MLGIDIYNRPAYFPDAHHGAIFGGTGTGKTNLIELILAGKLETGFAAIDPHGELIDRLLGMIPRRRTNDVIIIDPLADRVPGINLTEDLGDDALMVEQAVQFLKGYWKDAWGARTQWLTASMLYALVSGSPRSAPALTSLSSPLTDPAIRQGLEGGADPYIRQFFKHFNSFNPAFRNEVITPLLGKVQWMMMNPHIRAVLGQDNCKVSFTEAMDRGQIILCRLPQGQLGDATPFLGAALFTKLSQAARQRKNTNPYLCVMDEAHDFTKGVNLAVTLSESRKFGLFNLLATTHLELLSQEDRAAIFANCGTLAAFRSAEADAKLLAPAFSSDLQPKFFQNLPNFTCLYRTMGKDMPDPAVVLHVAPPLPLRQSKIREASLRRWGRPVKKVEARLRKRLKNVGRRRNPL